MSYNNYQNNQRGNQRGQNPLPARKALTAFYSEQGKKIINPNLFDTVAKEIAASFHDGRFGVSRTQLRRLFDEIKRFQNLLDLADSTWEEQFPYIRMMKSKIAYTVERAKDKDRKTSDYYTNLQKFINEGIDLIHDRKDYDVFVALFEAVYGYFYAECKAD